MTEDKDRDTRAEELRKRLREAVIPAFDRWGAQNLDALFSMSKDDPEAAEEARIVDLFMSKRVFVPGFMRYVTQEVIESEDCQRQRRTLAKASLLSILHEAGLSPGELTARSGATEEGSKGNEQDQPYYTRKRVQEIMRDVYRETFFELPTIRRGKKKIDGRISNYSTVFSPHQEPPLDNPQKVTEFQNLDMLAAGSDPELKQRIRLNAAIADVTPEQVKDMLSFRKLCSELLLQIGDYSELGKLLTNELDDLTEVSEVFHAHILSILSIEWFRSRRESEKHSLLHEGFPLKYTEEDAVEASVLLRELLKGDGDWVVSNLQVAALAFVKYEMFEYSRVVYRQLLRIKEGDALWTGVLHENMAMTYRSDSSPKLMVQEMKLATESYKQSGDVYRACVALKNLGEAEWMLGYPDLAKEYFGEAEELATRLDRTQRAHVFTNLAVASMRLKQVRMEIDYIKKFLEVAPEEWTVEICNASARLGELVR